MLTITAVFLLLCNAIDVTLLTKVSETVQRTLSHEGFCHFQSRWVLVVTWHNVSISDAAVHFDTYLHDSGVAKQGSCQENCNQNYTGYPLNSHLIFPLNSPPKLLNYFLSLLLYFTLLLYHFDPFLLLFSIWLVPPAFSVFRCTV